MPNDAKSPSAVAGAKLRQVRVAAGRDQDDIAAAARHMGLRWTQATVAAIERGRRDLAYGEALLLPWVIYMATGVRVRAEDFLGDDGEQRVSIGASIATAAALRSGMAGEFGAEPGWFEPPWFAEMKGEIAQGVSRSVALSKELDAGRLPERRAAERLGVTPNVIVEAAYRLWGSGLTAERTRRLSGSESAGRASAGHVTRKLLGELQAAITKEG